MTSYLDNGYDVMNSFAKFEKFLPHSITIPSFMTVGDQMPEFDWEADGGSILDIKLFFFKVKPVFRG